MRINISDTAKVVAALASVNGRATAHTVTAAHEVREIAKSAEQLLDAAGMTKAERRGSTVTFQPDGPSSRAYKWAAKSTRITLERGASDWFVVGVAAIDVFPAQAERFDVAIPARSHASFVARQSARFQVRQ